MKKYIKNLEENVSSVLNESLVADAAELVGIEEQDAEDRIKGLSFANYLELGNAIELEDEETAREILGTVAPIEEKLIKGRPENRTATYRRKGGNKQQYKWKVVLNNGKEKQIWADSRKSVDDHLSSDELIIGVKSAKRMLADMEEDAGGAGGAGGGAGGCAGGSGGGTGAGSVGTGIGYGGSGIGTWDGKKKKKKKSAPKNMGKGIYEGEANELYHVTHTEYVSAIQKVGLRPLGSPSNWVQQGSGERYGAGEIYLFTNKQDAKKWAARMDWDYNHTIGSGNISIVTVNRPADHDFEKDESDPLGQSGAAGEWLKTYEPISPEYITGVQVFKSMKEADNPYASAPSQGSSVDALAQQTQTAQPTQQAGDEEQNNLEQRKGVDDLNVGDDIEVIDIDGDPTAVTVKTPRGPGDTLVVQTDKGKEHIVKKQSVSGTPTIQEMYESALTDRIVEAAPIGNEHFQDNMPAKGLVRIEGGEYDGKRGTVLNIQGDYDEDGYGVLTHTIKLQSGGTVEVDLVETHYNDIYLIKVGEYEYDDEAQDEFAWSNPFENIEEDNSYESALTDRVHEAHKTEHSGAKKGKGAYYGRKKDAKSDSNKQRRANDKKALDEDKTDFVNKMTGMPDLGDYIVYINRPDVPYILYKKLGAGEAPNFLRVDKETGDWQTQYGKRNDASAVDRGFGAGSHAVDESMRRMRELAGLKETSSAGGTGAGAIASAPAAMNGDDPIRRSIYDKPKPKKRTKESNDGSIGRAKKK